MDSRDGLRIPFDGHLCEHWVSDLLPRFRRASRFDLFSILSICVCSRLVAQQEGGRQRQSSPGPVLHKALLVLTCAVLFSARNSSGNCAANLDAPAACFGLHGHPQLVTWLLDLGPSEHSQTQPAWQGAT